MEKTTVYLPERLKQALERTARRRNISAAQLLREAVARIADDDDAPSPRLPLFRARGPSIAATVDRELAKGFGRR